MKSLHSFNLAVVGLAVTGLIVLVLSTRVSMVVGALTPGPALEAATCDAPPSPMQRVAVEPTGTTPAPAVDSVDAVDSAADAADATYSIRARGNHPAADALYETTHTAHGLHIGFTPRGLSVVNGPARAELSMQLCGIGYGDRLQRAGDGNLFASGSRIDYHRTTAGGAPFTEWYVNRDEGIEQGFTLPAPVGARGSGDSLVVQLHLAGDFTARQTSGCDAIELTADDGSASLSYDGLYAFDANGRELPSHMVLAGDRLALVVDDSAADYPVTIDPKIAGGGGRGGGNSPHADVEVRDATGDGIRSDLDDNDAPPFDYSDGADKVQAWYSFIELRMGTKGISNPRQAQFDLGPGRLLPRDSSQQYLGDHGDLPPGVDADGVLRNSVQFNTWGSRAYLADSSSPSGWVVGPPVVPEDMAEGEVAHVALNINLIEERNGITWRLWFGPGNVGPIRPLDAQPARLTRVNASTWTIEALDVGMGVRAALLKYVAASNTFEAVDHYDLPFAMTFTKQ